jgi:hypothetical protein
MTGIVVRIRNGNTLWTRRLARSIKGSDMGDKSITKVSAATAPRGPMGQKHLASGDLDIAEKKTHKLRKAICKGRKVELTCTGDQPHCIRDALSPRRIGGKGPRPDFEAISSARTVSSLSVGYACLRSV